MVLPSHEPEYAVVAYKEISYHKAQGKLAFPLRVSSEAWFLERVEPRNRIWRWSESTDDELVLDIQITRDLLRQRIPIDPADLETAEKAWFAVLSETKYTNTDRTRLDGTTFQFYVQPGLFGETHSPSEGPAYSLMLLGELLARAVLAPEQDRQELLSRIDNLAKEILN